MELQLEPGTYVVAVSGGVDSVVLLHILAQRYGSPVISHQASGKTTGDRVRLIVAHFDHGIRKDSDLDRQLVASQAEAYGFAFVHARGKLGGSASEDAARKARYEFLQRVQKEHNARAIITAHHQDDVLETAILNIIRGTGPRGLTALRSGERLKRPLLHVPKTDLITYAKQHGLVWREDVTNQDTTYLRNYIRHKILPRLSDDQRQELLSYIERSYAPRQHLELALMNYLHVHPALDRLDRHAFIMLPHVVAREVMGAWLRKHQVHDISSRLLERLVWAAKTFTIGQATDVDKTHVLSIDKKVLALKRRER